MNEKDYLDLELLYADWKQDEPLRAQTAKWVAKQQREKRWTAQTPLKVRLSAWLDYQRQTRWKAQISVGARVLSWLGALGLLLFIIGFVLGLSALNTCFAGHIGHLPGLLLLGAVVPFFLSLGAFYFILPSREHGLKLPLFLRDITCPLVRWGTRRFENMLEAQRQVEWGILWARILEARTQYQGLLALQLSCIFQYLGLGYVLALVGKLTLQFAGSTYSFSWGGTFEHLITPESWSSLLKLLSLGLSGVDVEMMQRAQDHASLADRHSIAVAIILILLIWAIVPRLILAVLTRVLKAREKRRFNFSELYYHPLTSALLAPYQENQEEKAAPDAATPQGTVAGKKALLLLSPDCGEEDMPGLAARLSTALRTDYPLADLRPIEVSSFFNAAAQSWRDEVELYVENTPAAAQLIIIAEPLFKPNVPGVFTSWLAPLREPNKINYQGEILFVPVGTSMSGIVFDESMDYSKNWINNIALQGDRRLQCHIYS